MGTNFYLRRPPCPHCGTVPAMLHIGKSSAGWNFGLRIYPKIGEAPTKQPDHRLEAFGVDEINELDDWRPLFERFLIVDEYDRVISSTKMISNITERAHPNGLLSRCAPGKHMGPYGGMSLTPSFPGKGTYDLCNYEFS